MHNIPDSSLELPDQTQGAKVEKNSQPGDRGQPIMTVHFMPLRRLL